jgi:hypothetical protein
MRFYVEMIKAKSRQRSLAYGVLWLFESLDCFQTSNAYLSNIQAPKLLSVNENGGNAHFPSRKEFSLSCDTAWMRPDLGRLRAIALAHTSLVAGQWRFRDHMRCNAGQQ